MKITLSTQKCKSSCGICTRVYSVNFWTALIFYIEQKLEESMGISGAVHQLLQTSRKHGIQEEGRFVS